MVQRVIHASSGANENGTGKTGFVDRVPGVSSATVVPKKWANEVQEALVRLDEHEGYTASGHISLARVENRRVNEMLMRPFVQLGSAPASIRAIAATSTQDRGITAAIGAARYRAVAVCGQNILEFAAVGGASASLSGAFTVTGEYRAVGCTHIAGELICLAVGDGGVWARGAATGISVSDTGGTAAFTPDLTGCRYLLGKWWAWGPNGLFSADDETSMTWTRHSTAAILGVSANGTRLVALTSTGLIYSTSPFASFTTGATVTGTNVQWDPSTETWIVEQADGWSRYADPPTSSTSPTATVTGMSLFGTEDPKLFRIRNRLYLLYPTFGGSDVSAIAGCIKDTFSDTPADWKILDFGHIGLTNDIANFTLYAACGEFMAFSDETNVWVTEVCPDIVGTMSALHQSF